MTGLVADARLGVTGRGAVPLGASGLAAALAGWIGASQATKVDDQLLWINVGVCGAVLGALACLLYVLALAGTVSTRRTALLARLEGLVPPETSVADDDRGPLVASAAMRRYHRPSCHLATGKPVAPFTVEEHHAIGRIPCGVCRP